MNFRITDDDLGAGGPKTKYKANVEAIRVLQTLDVEQRQATAEEQEILSRYVGWGGIPQAFDENNAEWSKEYAELQSLLTADEYKEARASTLNAFYTSPTVIKAMYEALGNMGLSKGNVLEPSCGVGNFMGLLRDAYIEKKKALSEKLAVLQDSIRTEKEEQECADELDEEIRALTKQASEKTYIGGLTKECVDAFVSMVYLYDDQTMKIEFNCEDVIRRALEKYGA